MKKFLMILCASTPSRLFRDVPSVKGIYMIIFMIFTTYPIFSQVEKIQPNKSVQKWELGIDAGSMFLKENSTPLFLRYYLKTNRALRMGLGINIKHQYSQKERFEYFDTSFIRAYNTIRTNTYSSTIFLGYQIEKEFTRFSLYTASDLLFSYDFLKDEVLPDSIFIKYSPPENRFQVIIKERLR